MDPDRHRQALKLAGIGAVICLVVTGFYQWQLANAGHKMKRSYVLFDDPALSVPNKTIADEVVAMWPLQDGARTGVRAWPTRYCPIVRWVDVHEVQTAGGETLYVTPDLKYYLDRGLAGPLDYSFRYVMLLLCTLLVGAAVYLAISCGTIKGWILAAVLLRLASLAWSYALFGFHTIHAGDESHYYNTAAKLLNWELVHDEYPYTIGNPLLYVPVMLLTGGLSEMGFMAVCSGLYFVVFGLGIPISLIMLTKRLTGDVRLAGMVGIAVVVYPWLMRLFHTPGAWDSVFSYFGLWLEFPVECSFIDFYYFTDWVAYNAMSDSPAMMFGVFGLLLLTCSKPSRWRVAVAGVLLSFSCLVRISNVFYVAPAIFLIIHYRRREGWKDILLCGAAAAAVGMLQLLWNYAIFDNPLTFGYSKRPADWKGFQWEQFRNGMHLLTMANQQLFAVAGLGLFVRDRHQVATRCLLALLIAPILLFYCGYHAVGMNPVRYILTPLLAMIATAAVLCSDADARRRRFSWLPIAAAALTVPGMGYIAYLIPVPVLAIQILLVMLAVAFWFYGRYVAHVSFFVVLAIGHHGVTIGWLICACVFTVVQYVRQQAVSGTSCGPEPCTDGADDSPGADD